MTTKWNEIPSLKELLNTIAQEGECVELINTTNKQAIEILTIENPVDGHLHLRNKDMLKQVTPLSAKTFTAAVIMPNVIPPIETLEQLQNYKNEIGAATGGAQFVPHMTVNFKDYTKNDLQLLNDSIIGVKMYPKGGTTNSESGVNGTEIEKFKPTLEAMQELRIPLLVHGEITDGGDKVDILDKERRFADTYIALAEQFSELKIIMEHISTKELVNLVKNNQYKNLFATVTLQHLLTIHNHILEGGVKTHNMCMPIPKLYDDRKAILTEVLKGNPKIMFGSDSAPHAKYAKENTNGCCGCFTSPIALQALIELFEYFGELPKLQDFVSGNAQNIYRNRLYIPQENKSVTFEKQPFIVPESYGTDDTEVVPFMAKKELAWSIKE